MKVVWGTQKSLSILLTVAVGALLTVIHFSEAETNEESQGVENYWHETDLQESELLNLIQDSQCHSSRRYFLACINSLSTVSHKLNSYINFAGQFENYRSQQLIPKNEKLIIKPWYDWTLKNWGQHQRISFPQLWNQLKEFNKKNQNKKESYLIGIALNGFLSIFRDPHTYLVPTRLYKEVIAASSNKSNNLGIVVAPERRNFIIKKVSKKSLAEEAGLRRDDLILAVNGVKTEGITSGKMSELLKANENEITQISIQRSRQILQKSIIRKIKEFPNVTSQKVASNPFVHVITINKFSDNTCSDVKNEFNHIRKKTKIEALILDLRENPGGQIEEASCLVGLFVGSDKLIFKINFLDTAKNDEKYFSEEKQIYTGPLGVLINSGSASAAEIVAGALQDFHRAVILGERSFGKGTFQEGEIWKNNEKIAFFQTKGFYLLPSGRSAQIIGIEPDINLKLKKYTVVREGDQYQNPLQPPQIENWLTHGNSITNPSCLTGTSLAFIQDQVGPADEQLDLEIETASKWVMCQNDKTARIEQ